MNNNTHNTHTLLTPEEFIRKADIASQNTCTTKSCAESFLNIEINDFTLENKLIIRADFSFSRISGCTFKDINFEGTEFDFTELENVVFIRCKLRRSSFDYARMHNVKFIECDLDVSSFDFASGAAYFEKCKVECLELNHTLAELHFVDASGEGIDFNDCPDLKLIAERCHFLRGQFYDCKISGKLTNCCLSESIFFNCDCSDLAFVECKMRDLGITDSAGVISGKDDDDNEFDFDFE